MRGVSERAKMAPNGFAIVANSNEWRGERSLGSIRWAALPVLSSAASPAPKIHCGDHPLAGKSEILAYPPISRGGAQCSLPYAFCCDVFAGRRGVDYSTRRGAAHRPSWRLTITYRNIIVYVATGAPLPSVRWCGIFGRLHIPVNSATPNKQIFMANQEVSIAANIYLTEHIRGFFYRAQNC